MATALAVEAQPAATPRPAKFRLVHLARIVRPIALDFVATLLFAGFYALTGNLLLATGAGVAAGVGQVAWRLATRRPVAAMQWAALGLVIVTAAIALLTHNPLVVMLKPTLIYGVIGTAMLRPGWMLRYAPPMERSPIPPKAFVAAGFFVAALMLVSGALNLYFALATSAKTWAAFIAVYPITAKLAGFGLTFVWFCAVARHNKRRGCFFPATPPAAVAQQI
jgi:intracellular septation protein A